MHARSVRPKGRTGDGPYLVFHINSATPLKQRFRRAANAQKRAARLGSGWLSGTEEEFLRLPFTTLL